MDPSGFFLGLTDFKLPSLSSPALKSDILHVDPPP